MNSIPSTSQWWASTPFSFYNVRYTHHSCRGRQPCALLAVEDYDIQFPCFRCSGVPRYDDYLLHSCELLTFSIRMAYFPHVSLDCAAAIAADVVNTLLIPLSARGFCSISRFFVDIWIGPNPAAFEAMVMMESAEEAPSKKKGRATIDALLGLVIDRAHREIQEDGRSEAGWKESEHDCVICLEEIDDPWCALTMPCSHEFHEECLLRWLDDSNACPLCRFELPHE